MSAPISESQTTELMRTEHLLVIFFLNHLLQLVGLISAMLFLIVSWKLRLYKTKSLLLLHSLIICDFLHFVMGLPYTLYLTLAWNSVRLDYDPLVMFSSSIIIMIHIKTNLVLLIGIASDRVMAIYFPTYYRFMNHRRYAAIVTTLAIFVGGADYISMWLMSPVTRHPGCSAVGCFVSVTYRIYWGTTNGLMGLCLLIITVTIVAKLQFMANAHFLAENSRDYQTFQKANQVAMCSLVSGVFIMVPSMFIGFFQFSSMTFFRAVGPFYLSCLLTAGCCNSVSQLLLNRDLSTGCKTLFSTTPTAVTVYQTEAERNHRGTSS